MAWSSVPEKVSATATGWWSSGAATLTVTVDVDVAPLPLASVYVNATEPLKPWFGVKVRLPSAFIVTVPCGSVTGVVGLIAWPATAVMVRPEVELSLARGSNDTGVLAAVFSVSGLAVGAVCSGATAWACGAAVGATSGLKSSDAGVTDSESRPTRRPSSRLPAAPPEFGPAAGTTSMSPLPTCVMVRSTSSLAPASSVVGCASSCTMPSCAVRTTSPFLTTSPTCSGVTVPSRWRMCASPQTPTTLPVIWRTGT